jgi:hypothetical protein
MARRLKLLSGLSLAALAGAPLAGCGEKRAAAPDAAAAPAHDDAAAGAPVGGEAEGGAIADAATDAAAYLSALQIIRGHLRAGVELYAAGDRTLGPQHLRHPQAEILTSLAPAFAAHGADNVEPPIDALAAAAERGAPPSEIAAHEARALAAIGKAAAAAEATLEDRLLAAARTLTVAADEYSVAVKDGAIVNLHEYHDAYGFIATAIADLRALDGGDAAERQAIAAALDQALIAAAAAPTVAPPRGELKPPSVIYGAAARVEIAARSL